MFLTLRLSFQTRSPLRFSPISSTVAHDFAPPPPPIFLAITGPTEELELDSSLIFGRKRVGSGGSTDFRVRISKPNPVKMAITMRRECTVTLLLLDP
jgi:hypothetical protein